MLSSVVVGVRGRPGHGFYDWARRLGRLQPGQDETKFWEAELEATYRAWRRPLPGA